MRLGPRPCPWLLAHQHAWQKKIPMQYSIYYIYSLYLYQIYIFNIYHRYAYLWSFHPALQALPSPWMGKFVHIVAIRTLVSLFGMLG